MGHGSGMFGAGVDVYLRRTLACVLVALLTACASGGQVSEQATVTATPSPSTDPPAANPRADELNDRLSALAAAPVSQTATRDYRIGADDLLDITVFEADELSRAVRVSGNGEISMPLLGVIPVAGLTPREVEGVLVERLAADYMVDPHVAVTVTEMQSHPVSVVGAVNKPGVVQIRGSRTLLEVLALAEGLAEDAGEQVIVMRGDVSAGFEPRMAEESLADASTVISLTDLLESADVRHNVPIYPGDIVKVQQAGIVYVVGEVTRPGSFAIRANEQLTVLRAVALGEGLLPTASKGSAVILRTDATGVQTEIPVDLGDVLAGRAPDLALQSEDVLWVPNSTSRSVARGLANAFMRMITLRAVF